MVDARTAATQLRAALEGVGLRRTYQAGDASMSTVSVWSNLTVWCAGDVYFWRVGRSFREFAHHPIDDPAGAAVKIQGRYDELRDGPDRPNRHSPTACSANDL